jgi:hypothetical protein
MANPLSEQEELARQERAARMGGTYDYGGAGGNLSTWVSGQPLPGPGPATMSQGPYGSQGAPYASQGGGAPFASQGGGAPFASQGSYGGADPGYQMPATRMPGGYASPPDQHLAGRDPRPNDPFKIDASAHIEAMKKGQFDMKWKSLFFLCACVIFGSAILSLVTLFVTLDWQFGLVQSIYASVFGLIMLVMDFPRPDSTVDYLRRRQITKYFRFLTLFCGRGCTYVFLSTLAFSMLHDLAGFSFMGYVCGGFTFLVGCVSLYVGVTKSLQLRNMRQKLVQNMEQNPQFVKNYMTGTNVMGVREFQAMARSLGNYDFDEEQAVYIFDAIRGGPIDGEPTLDEGDLLRWAVPNSGESLVIVF